MKVNEGELASGLIGEGRMAEPEEIVQYLEKYFEAQRSKKKLNGIKALVSAGPTQEAIDPVRFISNHSSGKMGIALAETLNEMGAQVTLVLGPVSEKNISASIKIIDVKTADEMHAAMIENFKSCNVCFMAAAVADYAAAKVEDEKIKKQDKSMSIELEKTKDILSALGVSKTNKQTLVGFALETNNEEANAIGKLQKKNLDFIVLNSLKDANAGFGFDTNKVTVFNKKGVKKEFSLNTKKEIAQQIINYIINV
jgi:phosphopantothenoylcysteine decarboxylase/phosphopantothenate--cysteine ligase